MNYFTHILMVSSRFIEAAAKDNDFIACSAATVQKGLSLFVLSFIKSSSQAFEASSLIPFSDAASDSVSLSYMRSSLFSRVTNDSMPGSTGTCFVSWAGAIPSKKNNSCASRWAWTAHLSNSLSVRYEARLLKLALPVSKYVWLYPFALSLPSLTLPCVAANRSFNCSFGAC